MALLLYRLHLKNPEDAAELGLRLRPGQPLYIGVTAKDDLERPYRHIKPGRATKGTVRKTLMAKWPDRLIDGWFADRVVVEVVEYPDISREQLEKIERDLIRQWEPPLNLAGWDNPLRSEVRAGRAELRRRLPRITAI
jgi:hypothetical protein